MFIQTVNIAGLPLAPNEVTQILDEMTHAILLNQSLRAIKVIHGNGGVSRAASLKLAVRSWAEKNRIYFKGVIPGERYRPSNPTFLEMREACGEFTDPDLGIDNSGVTFIWVK